MAIIIGVPILSLTTIRAFSYGIDQREILILPFVLGEALHLILFLTLCVMIGIAVGLGARSRLAAILKAIGVLVAVNVLPFLLDWSFNAAWTWGHGAPDYLTRSPIPDLSSLSPMSIISRHHLPMRPIPTPIDTLGLMACGAMILALRAWCSRVADRKLGRPI